MKNPMDKNIFSPVLAMGGKVGIYYKNLVTGDTFLHNADMPLQSASVIKLPILVHAMKEVYSGRLNRDERYILKDEDKLPSCGALNVLHAGCELTMQDLYTLMIILSDNSATNLIIKKLGMDSINATLRELKLSACRLNRLLFDSKAASLGLENYVSAADMGKLLEGIYTSTLISKDASDEMLSILKNQRLKGKIPLGIPRGVKTANKTGEDDGITNDVGIVFAKQPFIICFIANEVDAPSFDQALHTVCRQLYELNE